MKRGLLVLLSILCWNFSFTSNAQVACPTNIDFEQGNTSVWNYYIGSVASSGVCCMTSSAALPSRHRLTSGTAVDPYGGFPIVAPSGGSYSLKLGNSGIGAEAERARYYVHIPTGITNYGLVYRFAVVLEDPGTSHTPIQKPRFDVSATDSTTGAAIACSNYSYIAGGTLPGFYTSSSTSTVQCLAWTTATINLSGLGGATVIIDFTSADCSLGGHFGYGYLDMNCSLYNLATLSCDSFNNTLTAPFGYQTYQWYDSSTFSTVLATTQTVTFTTTTPTTYAVVLTPFPGYGCADTLYTRITPSNLQIRGMNDTMLCFSSSITMDVHATDIIGPLTYSWSPATGLSCTTCANPIATPTGATTYYVTVTNPAGCTRTDTITISGDFIPVSISSTPASCHGYSDGTGTVSSTATLGYQWSSSPPQYTATATGLPAGNYTVTVVDSAGCIGYLYTTVTEPPAKIITFPDTSNPTTCGGNDGTITIGGLVPGSTDTIDYVFGGTHTRVVVTATGTGTYVFTGLVQGTYDSFSVITALCPYNIIGPKVLVDPPYPAIPYAMTNTPVCLGDSILLTCLETSTGCNFRWFGPGGYTTTTQNPFRTPSTYADTGMYRVVVERANCFVYDTTYLSIKPKPIPSVANNSPFCEHNNLSLTSSSSNGATSYSWQGPNYFSSIVQNPNLSDARAIASGVYTVTMILNGCRATATTNVIVNPVPPPPAVADTVYCQYDVAVPLTAAGINLVWYTVPSGGTPIAGTPSPPTIVPGTSKWYVSQTSAQGCTSDRSEIKVTVDPFPQISMSRSDSVLCVGNSVTFVGHTTGEQTKGITWRFGSDSVLGQNPIVYSFDQPGTFTISVQTYYNLCPSQITSTTVTVFGTPNLNLGNDTIMCGGSGIVHLEDFKNGINPAARWIWSTGETGNHINVTRPGLYYAKVIIDGCEATDTILITKDCYVNIPTVFTPNGDGINDYFFPRDMLSKGLTSFKMDIYNRWGQVIFTTNSTSGRGWDGTLNGMPQPEGVFIYMIDAAFHDGNTEHHHGNVTLLR